MRWRCHTAGLGRVGVKGCDAVVHAASMFSFDPRRRREIQQANVRGAEIVLGTAARQELGPIVHVSSFGALLPARERPLTPHTEPGRNGAPYARSKAAQERVARRLQQEGAPIVIVQPGAIFGPHDPHFGESDQLTRAILARKMPIVPAGGVPIVYVRDVGACLARVVEHERAPRRVPPRRL
jgi:nucleoside-diphosphate-sugar epimerase